MVKTRPNVVLTESIASSLKKVVRDGVAGPMDGNPRIANFPNAFYIGMTDHIFDAIENEIKAFHKVKNTKMVTEEEVKLIAQKLGVGTGGGAEIAIVAPMKERLSQHKMQGNAIAPMKGIVYNLAKKIGKTAAEITVANKRGTVKSSDLNKAESMVFAGAAAA